MDEMLMHPFLKSEKYNIPSTMPICTLALPPPASFIMKLQKNNGI